LILDAKNLRGTQYYIIALSSEVFRGVTVLPLRLAPHWKLTVLFVVTELRGHTTYCSTAVKDLPLATAFCTFYLKMEVHVLKNK